MSSYSLVQMVILCPAAIAAAAFDWRSRRIPNVLVVAIAVAGLVAVALTLGSSRLPLAIGTGPGAEERRAVAVVVIGGQTLCLLLTLIVTPVAYSLLDDLGVRLRRRRGHAAAPAPA